MLILGLGGILSFLGKAALTVLGLLVAALLVAAVGKFFELFFSGRL